jgi:hypothetical protein
MASFPCHNFEGDPEVFEPDFEGNIALRYWATTGNGNCCLGGCDLARTSPTTRQWAHNSGHTTVGEVSAKSHSLGYNAY